MSKPGPRRQIDGILLLDKPAGISSNKALQRAKAMFRANKAGHTGSLDPLATGLLPVCFGQATKLCAHLLESDKRYRVRAKLGEQTDTGDADGEVITRSDPAGIGRDDVLRVLPRFTGEIFQRPPMYSALKKDGKRLYQLARRGETVERPPRRQIIHELSLAAFEPGYLELEVRCSKGTYIRSLVEDLAEALAGHAHVVALRRLESGPFDASSMRTFPELEALEAAGLEALDASLLPPLAALAGWARQSVDAAQASRLGQGQRVPLSGPPPPGRVAVQGPGGGLLGLGEVTENGELQPRTWMAGGGE